MTVTIDAIWLRIRRHEGSLFHTKTALDFTYRVESGYLITDRTDARLSKSGFAKALELVPFDGPSEINNLVIGPSYVWAILHDDRIRLTDY